jgi:hypothetical protein
MNRPGEHGFAGATFPTNQESGIAVGHPLRHRQSSLHHQAPAGEIRLRRGLAEGFLERSHFLFQRPHFRDLADQEKQLIGGKRLGQVVKSAPAHGFHRRIDGGIGGDYHHLHPGRDCPQTRNQFQARFRPQTQINQRQVEKSARRLSQSVFRIADGYHAVTLGL